MASGQELLDLVVINRVKGPGKVARADDRRVFVDMWVNSPEYPKKTDSKLFAWTFNMMTDPDETFTWGMLRDSFLDSPDWSMAPSADDMTDLLGEISNDTSGVVIYTSNPPRPYEEAERIMFELKRVVDHGDKIYEKDMSYLRRILLHDIDNSINWFLLNHRETDQSYSDRLQELVGNVGTRSYEDTVFSALDDDLSERIAEHASLLSALVCLTHKMDPRDGVRATLDSIEKRMESRREIIGKFASSYDQRWVDKRAGGSRR